MSTQLDLVPVKPTTAIVGEPETRKRSKWFRLLVNDRVAAAAAAVLGLVFLTAIFGPMLVSRPRHPHRPRQFQPGAIHAGARMGQHPWDRPAGPQHAGPAHRRLPHHPVGRDPRRGDLRRRRIGDRHVGRLLPRLARNPRHARRRRDHELPVAAARGRRTVRVLPQRREHRSGAGDHAHPGLPAHRSRRVRRTAEPPVRRRRPHLRRQRALHHLAPRPTRRAADPADRRDPGLLLRHARRVLAELPRHRYPAARCQLGPDGVAGPHLPTHRVVAVVLPRPGHRHHHRVGDHPRRLGPHRHRPGQRWRLTVPQKRLSRFTRPAKA